MRSACLRLHFAQIIHSHLLALIIITTTNIRIGIISFDPRGEYLAADDDCHDDQTCYSGRAAYRCAVILPKTGTRQEFVICVG